ncbi:hypothetical protein ACFX10_010068 [Malus domestica]
MVVNVYSTDGKEAVAVNSDHDVKDERVVPGGLFEQGLGVSEAAQRRQRRKCDELSEDGLVREEETRLREQWRSQNSE